MYSNVLILKNVLIRETQSTLQFLSVFHIYAKTCFGNTRAIYALLRKLVVGRTHESRYLFLNTQQFLLILRRARYIILKYV